MDRPWPQPRRLDDRAERLQALTAALSEPLTPSEVAEVVVAEGLDALNARAGFVATLSPSEDELLLIHAKGYARPLLEHYQRQPLHSETPAIQAVQESALVLVQSREELAKRFPKLKEELHGPHQCWAAAPLLLEGRALGALSLSFSVQHPLEEDADFILSLARQCAQALERSRLYGQLKVTRGRLEAVLQQMPAGVLIVEAPSGKLLLGNAQVERIFQRRFPAGAEREQYFDLKGFHKDGRPYRTEEWPLARAMARGEVVTDEEIRIQRPDASWGTLRVSAGPIRDPAGRIVAGAVTFHDVTDRKRAEDALQLLARAGREFSSHLDYQKTVETAAKVAVPALADYCVIDIMEDGRLIRAASAHHHPEKAEWLKQDHHPPGPAMRDHPVMMALRSEQTVLMETFDENAALDPAQLELFRKLRPGATLFVPLTARHRTLGVLTLVMSDSGRHYIQDDIHLAEELARRCALALDNARLFREAQASGRLKDEFLATVSHELRTPLTPLIGWLDLLRSDNLSTSDRKLGLDTIERNVRKLLGLVDDMLDVSRIITGNLAINLQPSSVTEAIEAAVETARTSAQTRRITITASLEPGVGWVLGDKTRLQQIVWNLLANAIKFTPAGGKVELTLMREGDQARIDVRDTGEGIPPDFLPYLFDRFRQADGTPTRRHGGLGLGLAIVRHLVELHGGTVAAESAGVGQGALFTVRLPVHDGPRPSQEPVLAPASVAGAEALVPSGVALKERRVLLVADKQEAVEEIAQMLRQEGAEVRTIGCAGAVDELPRFKPHVLISDVNTPDDSTMLARIRALGARKGGNVPAVALTPGATAEERVRALRAGFQTHVPKPVKLQELTVVVGSLCGPVKKRRTPKSSP
jgi:PAS domain S-box-containing protein